MKINLYLHLKGICFLHLSKECKQRCFKLFTLLSSKKYYNKEIFYFKNLF